MRVCGRGQQADWELNPINLKHNNYPNRTKIITNQPFLAVATQAVWDFEIYLNIRQY